MNHPITPLRRIDLRKLLADPPARRRLITGCIIAIQAREGIVTTQAQAERAYDAVHQATACRGVSGAPAA